MSPLAELPALALPAVWALAVPALVPLVGAALLAAAWCWRRSGPPSPVRAALLAAAGTSGFAFAYDWCAGEAFGFLPTVSGCHCWITGAAGAIAAILVALLAVVLRACAIALVRAILGDSMLRLAALRGPGFSRVLREIAALRTAPLTLHGALRAPPLPSGT